MTENKEFLTIKEVAQLTNKATNTVRSLTQKCLNDDSIVRQLKKGKKFVYLINKNWVLKHYNLPQKNQDDSNMIPKLTQDDTKNDTKVDSKNTNEIISILKGVITDQQEQIRELTETLKIQQEITINQQKLTLADKGVQNTKKGFWQKLLGG